MHCNYLNLSTLCTILFLLPHLISGQCPTLVWADEFDGTSLDANSWNYQTGDGCDEGICGWGNQELQYYQRGNVSVGDGLLRITAKRENVGGKQYTSGRINTRGKQDFRYGRMEARIRLPAGRGLWPAFWMLSTEEVYGEWPQSGEIDIMEFLGSKPREVIGTIHFGRPWPNNQFITEEYELEEGRFPDDFHVFAIEWSPNEIRWFVDNTLYSVKTKSDIAPARWPFDQDFHFLLNVAVGGTLGGNVDNSIFPRTMEVDYVRVYDMGLPYISGDRVVSHAATGEVYNINNLPANATVNWTVPEGAVIVSGQGTSKLTMDWGTTGGTITADISSDCGEQTLEIGVEVEGPFARAFSFENFDDPPQATLGTFSGMHSEVGNPDPNDVNPSALSGRYQRNSGERFDVLFYNVTTITNANAYVQGEKRIFIDIYTDAPVGSQILLQLETAAAQPTNYPVGRHSRYSAVTREKGNWHRLEFMLLDRPDGSASSTGVNKMVLLFRPDTFTGDVYFYDNLDSYSQDATNPARSYIDESLQVQISPNPAKDILYVSIENPAAADQLLEVFSITGRRHLSVRYPAVPAGLQRYELSVSELPAGMYFLRIHSGASFKTLRMIKR